MTAISRISVLVALLGCLLPAGRADEAALTLNDLDGKPVAVLDAGEKKAVVIFFVSPYCPTSNKFCPEMNAIVKDFGGDFAFRFVHSDSTVTEEDRKRHAELMELQAPVLDDTKQALAKRLGATTTPETAVVDADGKTLYQGRINDLYLTRTKSQRDGAKVHDLRDALAAIRKGRPVANPRTEAMGCGIVIVP